MTAFINVMERASRTSSSGSSKSFKIKSIKQAIVGIFSLLLMACSSLETKETSIKHPNVLFIAIDDLNDWVEPLAGNEQTVTPNLAKFAKTGVNLSLIHI